MQRIGSNRNLIVLGIGVVALYAHLTIGKQIATSLFYVWYIILVLSILTILLLSGYAIRVLITRWQIQVAEAQMAIARATKEKRDVREFDRNMQVYQFGIDQAEMNRALHLNPLSDFNGKYQEPTQQQVAIFNQYNTRNQQNNYYGQEPGIADNPIPLLESGSGWLDDLIETSPHLHICGPSTSGKTTLGRYAIERMSKTDTEFHLINPKRVHYYQQWPVEPICDDIDLAVEALQQLVFMLQTRVKDKTYNPTTSNNIFIIIDDWDWVYEHHKSNALSLMMRLLKVGAELNFKVLLVGQSSLAKKTGIDTSAALGLARIALWAEGEKLINSLPIQLKDKAPLKEQIRQLRTSSNNIRYGVVVPMNSQPEVKIIPNLVTNDQLLIDAPRMEEMPLDTPSDEEMVIITRFQEIQDGDKFSWNKATQATFGEGKFGKNYKTKLLKILDKYDVNYQGE